MASACNFSVSFKGSAEELFKKTRAKLKEHNGTIEGDLQQGSFHLPVPFMGNVKGTYRIEGQVATFDISEKPGFVGCDMIKGIIQGYVE